MPEVLAAAGCGERDDDLEVAVAAVLHVAALDQGAGPGDVLDRRVRVRRHSLPSHQKCQMVRRVIPLELDDRLEVPVAVLAVVALDEAVEDPGHGPYSVRGSSKVNARARRSRPR